MGGLVEWVDGWMGGFAKVDNVFWVDGWDGYGWIHRWCRCGWIGGLEEWVDFFYIP